MCPTFEARGPPLNPRARSHWVCSGPHARCSTCAVPRRQSAPHHRLHALAPPRPSSSVSVRARSCSRAPTLLHAAARCCTPLHAAARRCTLLHAAARCCAPWLRGSERATAVPRASACRLPLPSHSRDGRRREPRLCRHRGVARAARERDCRSAVGAVRLGAAEGAHPLSHRREFPIFLVEEVVTLMAAHDRDVGQHVAIKLERPCGRGPLQHVDVGGIHPQHHLARRHRLLEASVGFEVEHRLRERVVDVDATALGRRRVAGEGQGLHVRTVRAPRVVGAARPRGLARWRLAAQQRERLHLHHVARRREAHQRQELKVDERADERVATRGALVVGSGSSSAEAPQRPSAAARGSRAQKDPPGLPTRAARGRF
eukprot:CAMPEP_0115842672 /NCGR_PEP_ID=MMETSP0287-20121206/7920_1 /TAXON_ID=412157 /ORGANISM="Chrysochromulina rotalis, Strain UIO044" /LENGTH=372 /DNA_ID=CAMNT_0003296347 /DNA_START=207 /DNA_END=1322 /DNA_ORIENTATION=+